MPRYLLNLSDSQMSRLKELSSNTGYPMSHLMRTGIDLLLQNAQPCGIILSGNQFCSGQLMLIKVG